VSVHGSFIELLVYDKEMAGSRYAFVKEGWGSRKNFQASYGLSMEPEDMKAGGEILDEICRNDLESEGQRSGHGKITRADLGKGFE